MTRRILELMQPGASLKVFELDQAMRKNLEEELHIPVYSDACDLVSLAAPQSLDLVVSSLPWTTQPKAISRKILHGVLTCLKPGGQFLAYQYSRQMRHCFRHLFGKVEMSFVLRNIPPAFVYNCKMPRIEQVKNIFYYLHS